MNILITGATGLVGTQLIEQLFLNGKYNIRVLTRNPEKAQANSQFPVKYFHWNYKEKSIDTEALKDIDIIFHLAGESVAKGRWNKNRKQEILNSRKEGSEFLIKSLEQNNIKPKKFISASAIGIYGDRDKELLNENSSLDETFLANVCKNWEEATLKHSISEMKNHIIRVGIVLSKDGGALKQMLPPFKAGVAGNLGSGKQFMSWIHIKDLVNQFIFLMENECEETVFNGVSPNTVTNKEFTKTLGKVLSRPTLFPIPTFMIKLLFGEMSTILISSQNVIPSNFKKNNFKFQFENLEDAFSEILRHDLKGENVLTRYQWINKPLDEVFSFFSNEYNLEKITPPFLNFKVIGKSTEGIETGTLINYKLNLHSIPIKWTSKINSFEKNKQFVDEQISGPYKKWHHTHSFYQVNSGTLIKDKIIYKVPFGIIGQVFAGKFIAKDLNNIFNFRRKSIGKLL